MICRVTEPFSIFCILPSMAQALSARPRAAVAVGVVLWMFRARSTIFLELMATALTQPSVVMARKITSGISVYLKSIVSASGGRPMAAPTGVRLFLPRAGGQ